MKAAMGARGRVSRIALFAAALLAALAAVAGAATLLLSDGGLGAGGAAVQRCDTDGFTYTSVVSAGSVTSVTVSGIDAQCAGGGLTVTLADTGGAPIGAGTVTLPTLGFTGTATVPVSPQPLVTAVNRFHGIILGP